MATPEDRTSDRLAKRTALALTLYGVVAFAYMWVLALVPTALGTPLILDHRHLGGWLYIVGMPAPLIAAVAATAATEGAVGVRALFARALRWRFSPAWYALAIAVPFGVLAAGVGLAVAKYGAHIPARWFAPAFGTSPTGLLFLAFFLADNGFGEEIGWRGFALPRLQWACGSLGGSVALGVVWALWHVPLFFIPGTLQYGTSLAVFVYLLTCWTIVMTALVGKARGSILPAVLFHESVNFIAFAIHVPRSHTLWLWSAVALLAIPLLPRPLLAAPWRHGAPPHMDRTTVG